MEIFDFAKAQTLPLEYWLKGGALPPLENPQLTELALKVNRIAGTYDDNLILGSLYFQDRVGHRYFEWVTKVPSWTQLIHELDDKETYKVTNVVGRLTRAVAQSLNLGRPVDFELYNLGHLRSLSQDQLSQAYGISPATALLALHMFRRSEEN